MGGESFYIKAIHKAFQYFHNSPTTEKERCMYNFFIMLKETVLFRIIIHQCVVGGKVMLSVFSV